MALREDVCGGVLLPVGAPGWTGAEQPRVHLRQGADAQGQRLVYKRSPHVVNLEGGGRLTVQQQDFIPRFQTWRKMRNWAHASGAWNAGFYSLHKLHLEENKDG